MIPSDSPHKPLFVDQSSSRFACCSGLGDVGSVDHNPLKDLGSEIRSCKVLSPSNVPFSSGFQDNTSFSSCRRDQAPDSAADHVCRFGSSDFDPWASTQEFSFERWCRSLPSLVLKARTPFASFLRKTLHTTRGAVPAPVSALFPLPLPKHGVFESLPPRVSSRRRRKIEFDRAFHVIICALNFLHSDCSFPSVDFMCRPPSEAQSQVLWNLRVLLKAFGSSGESFSVPQSGRRSVHLLSGLDDLSRFVTLHGLSHEPYHRGFGGFCSQESPKDPPGEAHHIEPDLSRAEELQPYRSLDPSRLKLLGKANWDPEPFLGDVFRIPFLEPKVLLWTSSYDFTDLPDLDKEDPEKIIELAKIWDVNGLASVYPGVVSPDAVFSCIRCFNCYKSEKVDRQIGDRRGRNQLEVSIPGPSRHLPTGPSLAVLEVDPRASFVVASISDRKDFYHQLRVSESRAHSNLMWPPIPFGRLSDTAAASDLVFRVVNNKKKGREDRGDFLKTGGVVTTKMPKPSDLVHVAFNSIVQGDHLGVELATESHRGFLSSLGLLSPRTELVSNSPWRGSSILEGLVIDDYFVLSLEGTRGGGRSHGGSLLVPFPEPCGRRTMGGSVSQDLIQAATSGYDSAGLLGSPEKDVIGSRCAKVAGAELDSSSGLCAQGVVTLSAPARKRMALSLVSLCLSSLDFTSDVLHSCVLGGWVSCLLYRRSLMSVLFHSHSLIDVNAMDSDHPRVLRCPRKVAQELTLLAVLCPFMTSDLAAPIQRKVFASDSSDAKGAYVETVVASEVARVLWRSGSKKGGYARLQSRAEALARKLEVGREPCSLSPGVSREGVSKPIGLRYDFIEVCGGAAKVSSFMQKEGWVVGPCLDLDRSVHFDLASLTLVRWLCHLVESGSLGSFFVQPPCTTFSPAAHPALRSYRQPRGFQPSEKRTKLGTTLALRSLCLLLMASRSSVVGLLEQSRRSKMAWLPEWLWLRDHGLAVEEWLASCMYGSPHQKEFRLLGVNIDMTRLHRSCDRSHDHVVIQGRYTKPIVQLTPMILLGLLQQRFLGLFGRSKAGRPSWSMMCRASNQSFSMRLSSAAPGRFVRAGNGRTLPISISMRPQPLFDF